MGDRETIKIQRQPLAQRDKAVMFNKKKWNIWTFIKKNAFVILTMTAMFFVCFLSCTICVPTLTFKLYLFNMSPREIMYVTFPGELLMRILKMMVLPLVISSLITGMSNVGIKTYGRIGLRAFSYYMVTTVIATFTGIALAVSIKPGKSSRQTSEPSGGKSQTVQSVDSFLDLIRYSPVGFLFLLAGQIVKMADTTNVAHAVTMYTVTVITGLIIHSFITLPLIYFIVTQKNPLRFFAGILQALTTAFGTSSSSATLPVTLHCMEQNHNMDKIVTRFMLPMGATVNMDGSSLYEAVAALFIAQIHDIPFNFGQMIVLSLIVTAASSGSAGIPQAGMVTMVIVLSSAGLPTENIPLLLMVDWILDRLRTATNVLGDCVGVGVVQHLSKHELQGSSSARNNLEGKEMCSL
uniref:Amino acid transporter n=1 Tax=Kryptolebias marmoratus TaxID=37003 RepID=A0A3Q3BH61_KRYMA